MRTYYVNTILAAVIMIAASSCQSKSQHTTETALASMATFQSDRVIYIEQAEDNFKEDLVLHLRLNEEMKTLNSTAAYNKIQVAKANPSRGHIGPFLIEHSRNVKKEALILQKLVLEWVFEPNE